MAVLDPILAEQNDALTRQIFETLIETSTIPAAIIACGGRIPYKVMLNARGTWTGAPTLIIQKSFDKTNWVNCLDCTLSADGAVETEEAAPFYRVLHTAGTTGQDIDFEFVAYTV